MKPLHLLISLLLFVALPLHAQWQEVGNEQLPDDLEADSVQALSSSGLALKNASGELGLFIGADGNLGIQESTLANWSSAFSAIEFDQKSAFMSGSTAIHILMNAYYDGSNWRYIAADEASGYYQANGGHVFRVTTSTGSPGGVLTWNDAMQLTNNGNLECDGDIDFEGSAEFGDSSNTLTVYQPASEAMLAQPVFQGMVHDYADDIIHPATVGYNEYATFPCPWSTPGTVLESVKFIVKMGTISDRCNFSARRQSSGVPGTTTELVSFAGSDFHQSNGLTSISGSYYERSESIDHTLSSGQKVWAVVRLKAVNAETDAALHGIEWTFEKRAY